MGEETLAEHGLNRLADIMQRWGTVQISTYLEPQFSTNTRTWVRIYRADVYIERVSKSFTGRADTLAQAILSLDRILCDRKTKGQI